MRKKNGGNRTVRMLTVNKETLRRLTESELEKAAGGISSPSICVETTNACCVTR
jgi:hypothetical protein